MTKTIHQVWIQGEHALPEPFRANRENWQQQLPEGWSMKLWGDEEAKSRWPEYAEISHLCSHHAMRADLILARCLRDLGGLTMGTDIVAINPAGLFDWCQHNPTMVVLDSVEGEVSNGLAWSANPHDPFFECVCRHQLRDSKLLASRNVPAVTGPGAWWQTLRARRWDLCLVSVRRAYTRMWREKVTTNPNAWVNPGYAASWWHAAQK